MLDSSREKVTQWTIITCQVRYLDSEGALVIEPDIVIWNNNEYTISETAELTPRKGYTFYGTAIVIELKLCRGCRPPPIDGAKVDIDKLYRINSLHYVNDQSSQYFPLFARPESP